MMAHADRSAFFVLGIVFAILAIGSDLTGLPVFGALYLIAGAMIGRGVP